MKNNIDGLQFSSYTAYDIEPDYGEKSNLNFPVSKRVTIYIITLLLSDFVFISGAHAQNSSPPVSPQIRHLTQYYIKAAKLQKAGRLSQAIQVYKEFVAAAKRSHQPPQAIRLAYTQIYNIYARERDIAGIEATLQDILSITPKDADSLSRLARLEASQRKIAEAIKHAELALKLKPPPPIAAAAYAALGQSALFENKLPDAERSFSKAAALNPLDLDIRYNYALTLATMHKYAAAEVQAAFLCSKAPQSSPAWMLLAAIRQEGGDLRGALQACEKSVQLDPNNQIALFNRALYRQQLGNLKGAISAYEFLLARYPNDLRARFNLGILYEGEQNYTQAREQLILSDPLFNQKGSKDIRLYTNLAQVELGLAQSTGDTVLRSKWVHQAAMHLEKAISRQPGNIKLQYELADVYQKNQLYSKAQAIYQKRLEQDTTDRDAAYGLVNLDMMQGNPEAALSQWKSFLTSNPGDIIAHEQYATLLELRSKWLDAADQYVKVIGLNPKAGEAYLGEAHDFIEAGQPEKAAKLYNQIMKLDISAADVSPQQRITVISNRKAWRLTALQGLANIDREQNKPQQAITLLQQAVSEDLADAKQNHTLPHSDPYLEIAGLYQQLKQPDKAVQTLTELTQVLPNDPKGYAALGRLFGSENHLDQAADSLIKASQREKQNPVEYILEAADFYRSHQLPQKAITLYRSQLKMHPDNSQLLTPLAQTLELSGKDEEALKIYQTLLKSNPSLSWVPNREANILERLKRYPEAEAVRESQIKKDPTNASYYSELAHLYSVQNRTPDWINWLKERIQKTPANPELIGSLLSAYDSIKQKDTGVKYIDQLADHYHDDHLALEAYVQAYMAQGDKAGALTMMQRLVKLLPDDVPTLTSYADLLADNGHRRQAETIYLNQIARSDISKLVRAQLRSQLAQRLQLEGDARGAIAQYQAILVDNPYDSDTIANLITLLQSGNQTDSIITLCTNLLQKPGQPAFMRAQLYGYLGAAYEKQKNIAEAISQYQAALNAFPKYPAALSALQRLQKEK